MTKLCITLSAASTSSFIFLWILWFRLSHANRLMSTLTRTTNRSSWNMSGSCIISVVRWQLLIHNDSRYALEHFIYIQPIFGRSLEELKIVLLCELTTLFCINNLVCSIAFVCNEYFGDITVCMLINLLEPVRDVVESLLISAVVDQYDTHSPLVVSLSDCPEPLLTSCVPHLQFDSLFFNIDFLYLKVNTYKWYQQSAVGLLLHLPIVGMWLTGKLSSANRRSRQVLPTLESPMMINLSKWSYPLFWAAPEVCAASLLLNWAILSDKLLF